MSDSCRDAGVQLPMWLWSEGAATAKRDTEDDIAQFLRTL